jgi:lipid-binding SYLF domain-containing protein
VRHGAFAGINLSGDVLRPDRDANERAYGSSVAPRDVLFKNEIAVPAQARTFVRTLREESRATTGAK